MYNQLIKYILKKEGKKGKLNVVLMDDKAIRCLNKKYRKIDRATDVLSFSMHEDGVLGDIAISREAASRNARCFSVSLKDELRRLLVHGTLHILGYEHGKIMREKERTYLRHA